MENTVHEGREEAVMEERSANHSSMRRWEMRSGDGGKETHRGQRAQAAPTHGSANRVFSSPGYSKFPLLHSSVPPGSLGSAYLCKPEGAQW